MPWARRLPASAPQPLVCCSSASTSANLHVFEPSALKAAASECEGGAGLGTPMGGQLTQSKAASPSWGGPIDRLLPAVTQPHPATCESRTGPKWSGLLRVGVCPRIKCWVSQEGGICPPERTQPRWDSWRGILSGWAPSTPPGRPGPLLSQWPHGTKDSVPSPLRARHKGFRPESPPHIIPVCLWKRVWGRGRGCPHLPRAAVASVQGIRLCAPCSPETPQFQIPAGVHPTCRQVQASLPLGRELPSCPSCWLVCSRVCLQR